MQRYCRFYVEENRRTSLVLILYNHCTDFVQPLYKNFATSPNTTNFATKKQRSIMEFDLKELTARAFLDYVGPAFPSWWANNKKKYVLPSLSNISEARSNGSQYFMTLNVADKAGVQTLFPNEPLVSFSLTKTIVETATVGKHRRGKVKEYIATEDWQITIKGLCIDTNNPDLYPTAQVQSLNRLFEKNESLEVIGNKLFTLFDIRNIVLKDISFEAMEGKEGIQKYTIKAVSDMDFYAELDEKRTQLNHLY
nr:MAG TPA: hypothetical protein [Caudoviricetes sp.]